MTTRKRSASWFAGGDTAALEEVDPCNTQPCSNGPQDCIWSKWAVWSTCSVPCGTGTYERSRTITVKASGKLSIGCSGAMHETLACEANDCTPVDCKWGDWDGWSGCTALCDGGMKTRHRTVALAPRYGGELCPPTNTSEVGPCNTKPCTAGCKDGLFQEWGNWSACSCHAPYRWRTRGMVDDNYCGKAPSGLHNEYDKCEDTYGKCQTPDEDCELAEWADWSSCSCSCFGVRERTRTIKVTQSGMGKACAPDLKELQPCNPDDEDYKHGVIPVGCGERPPEPCVLTAWEEWGQCTTTCGGGQKQRARHIKEYPRVGGEACPKTLAEMASCNTESCTDTVCKDCEWGLWSDWGDCSGCSGERWRHRSIVQLPNDCGVKCDAKTAKMVQSCSGGKDQCEAPEFCAWTMWSSVQCPRLWF